MKQATPSMNQATPANDGASEAPLAGRPQQVDVRGPRFGATVTMVVLATALVVQGPFGAALVGYAVLQFLVATIFGLTSSPNARLFSLVRDRFGLGPATETEPVQPPQFSQLCGLVVAGPGLIAIASGATTLGWVLVSIVLALSALLSLTGLCVGCELYVLGQRLRARRA